MFLTIITIISAKSAHAPANSSTTPMTIVHIDNHPDWARPAPRWHCGSWVNQALRLPNVAKVITLGILSLIGTDTVWFSIDKDVLPASEALTNWDQGQMPLAAVKTIIETIGAHKRIVGADICGEFSPARHSNWLKRWEATMDQPQRGDDAASLARNESVDRELLTTIEKASR